MTVDGINDADFICLKFILPPFHHLRDTQQFCVLSSQLTGDVKTVTRSGKIKDDTLTPFCFAGCQRE